jgi:hypothetical protein
MIHVPGRTQVNNTKFLHATHNGNLKLRNCLLLKFSIHIFGVQLIMGNWNYRKQNHRSEGLPCSISQLPLQQGMIMWPVPLRRPVPWIKSSQSEEARTQKPGDAGDCSSGHAATPELRNQRWIHDLGHVSGQGVWALPFSYLKTANNSISL